ncbi:MAG: hypothetical protein ACR2F6_08440, partial [Mycobacteriales bacterium]
MGSTILLIITLVVLWVVVLVPLYLRWRGTSPVTDRSVERSAQAMRILRRRTTTADPSAVADRELAVGRAAGAEDSGRRTAPDGIERAAVVRRVRRYVPAAGGQEPAETEPLDLSGADRPADEEAAEANYVFTDYRANDRRLAADFAPEPAAGPTAQTEPSEPTGLTAAITDEREPSVDVNHGVSHGVSHGAHRSASLVRPLPAKRARLLERRRRTLGTIVVAALVSLLLAMTWLPVMWIAQIGCDVLLVGYLVWLRQEAKR